MNEIVEELRLALRDFLRRNGEPADQILVGREVLKAMLRAHTMGNPVVTPNGLLFDGISVVEDVTISHYILSNQRTRELDKPIVRRAP